MRILALAIALCLLPVLALAADVCGCASKCDNGQRDCCHRIVVLHACMKRGPCCTYHKPVTACDMQCCLPQACHKAPTPFNPCGDVCVPQMCHKPVTPYEPCASDVCIADVCHKPAVALILDDPCDCEE